MSGGGSGSSGGGGGSSGKVDWPSYLKEFHKDALVDGITSGNDVSMNRALSEAWDNSPFVDVAAFDPTNELATIQFALDDFASLVDGLDPTSDWEDYLTAVLAQATAILNPAVWSTYVTDANTTANTILGDSKTDELVDAYEFAQVGVLNKNIARLANGFGDINAVSSSAHIFAKAAMLYEHTRDVARFRAEAGKQLEQERLQVVLNGAATQATLKQTQVQAMIDGIHEQSRGRDVKLGLQDSNTRLQVEASRISIVAQKEQTDVEIELVTNDKKWNLAIWGFAAELMAGIQGGVPGSQGVPRQAGPSVLGGALSGAASGALAGGMATGGNPLGIGIGAVMGGASGFFGSR